MRLSVGKVAMVCEEVYGFDCVEESGRYLKKNC